MPARSSAVSTRAKRPEDSSLDVPKIRTLSNGRIVSFEDGLRIMKEQKAAWR